MPYIQGEPSSVPEEYRNGYEQILSDVFIKKGDIGYLTIDESLAKKGCPHRGTRAKWGRPLHTEAGRRPGQVYSWGRWANSDTVTLNREVKVLLANNLDNSCAIWDVEHEDTGPDGDIGNFADQYPYEKATLMKAGEVFQIGILTPHESLPVAKDFDRQFIRIVSSGVNGREPYFTPNRLMAA